ncbi:hypothetical protein MesoLjLc_22200 [Mesorhizobium sp. L-8-10]|uniref:FkbM family methyltransferase n=1 Tax=Mesorhizobium sp. L-8-10 TaxID=2744523 RepID=UPI001927FDB5|nr:FkbM family methyltransferase [Mesorhizobium sp. L-8-10]BCH30290.1 hypothetical protein MesoLjLc_22200 [Mesorhizobium sp. L-8-10]
MAWLTQKISLYADEMKFSARVPRSIRDKLCLMGSTVVFHIRNWLRIPADPTARLHMSISVEGYNTPVILRPHDSDISIFYEIFARRAYDIPAELLPPAAVRTIVDVGANTGLASLYFAARYPQATIFSVEPNPANFALLKENTAHEKRIVPIQVCLTAKADQQVYITNTGPSARFKMNTTGNGASVRGVNVAQLCMEHGVEHIDLLKVDIEGGEAQVFADASFLRRVSVVAAELHGTGGGGYNLSRFNEDLSRWGFRAWINENANDPSLVLAARR